jgi:hypothetical protein
MKSLQIPGDFLSTWMAAFMDAPLLDFREGNVVSSFKAGQTPAAAADSFSAPGDIQSSGVW